MQISMTGINITAYEHMLVPFDCGFVEVGVFKCEETMADPFGNEQRIQHLEQQVQHLQNNANTILRSQIDHQKALKKRATQEQFTQLSTNQNLILTTLVDQSKTFAKHKDVFNTLAKTQIDRSKQSP